MTIGVLHTTESDPGSGYAVDGYFRRNPDIVPHVLVDPALQKIFTYIAGTEPAKALRNLPGGVETNRRSGGVFQVEIVGRAADCGTYDDAWYTWLRDTLTQYSTFYGIQHTFYDGSRLALEEWSAPLSGWFGHKHVPENDHSDPGTLDLARLLPPLAVDAILAVMASLEPTTPISVSGQKYALVDVLGWTLEGINFLRANLPGDHAAAITATQLADELAKRLAS